MIAFLGDIYLKGIRKPSDVEPYCDLLADSERLMFRTLVLAIEAVGTERKIHVINLFDALRKQMQQFFPAEVSFLDIGEHATIRDAFNWLSNNPLSGGCAAA